MRPKKSFCPIPCSYSGNTTLTLTWLEVGICFNKLRMHSAFDSIWVKIARKIYHVHFLKNEVLDFTKSPLHGNKTNTKYNQCSTINSIGILRLHCTETDETWVIKKQRENVLKKNKENWGGRLTMKPSRWPKTDRAGESAPQPFLGTRPEDDK